MQIAAARIFVRDLGTAQAFYQQQLGLRLKSGDAAEGHCVFDGGRIDLVLERVPDAAPDEQRALVGRFTGLSFMVADIAASQRELAAAGVGFDAEPSKQDWGGWLSTFADPAGNRLQLVQYPG